MHENAVMYGRLLIVKNSNTLMEGISAAYLCSPKGDAEVISIWLTSMEHPISEDLSWALSIMLKRFGGAFSSSYISVTPPVKSSMASTVVPPFSASYDP